MISITIMDPNSPYQPPIGTPPTPAPQTPMPVVDATSPAQSAPYTVPPQSIPAPQQYPQPQNTWTQSPLPGPSQPQSSGMSYGTPAPYTPPPRPKSYDQLPLPMRIVEWLKKRWYVPLAIVLVCLVIGNIAWQVAYPLNNLPPGLVVDGVKVGGIDRDKAVSQLNSAYGRLQVKLFFGDATVPYKTPSASQLGISVDNTTRLADASYPFALRFVPTSYWWAANLVKVGAPVYNYDKSTLDIYALKNLGEDCVIPPKNASLKLDDDQFAVIPSEPGGKCNLLEFKDGVSKATYAAGFTVKTPVKKVDATLTDDIAKQLGDELNNNLKNDMPLQAAGETTQVKSSVVKSWLSFKPFIPEDKNDGAPLPPPRLLYIIEPERVQRYLQTSGIAAKVEKKPGVTKISTTDFTETSRTNGTPGVLIDITKTIASIDPFINSRAGNATVVVGPVPPTEQYTRKYTPSDAGYRALIQQFAQDNPGKIGIVMRELSGKRPLLGGTANDTMQLPAAGAEGMYLAYAAEKGIEDGSIQPTDRVFGNLSYTDCMNAAITSQDGDCITALLGKIGNATVTARLSEIGLTGTSFSGDANLTTANDMALFMQKLDGNQLPIRQRDQLISPLRDISLRDGIKSAAQNARVAGGATDTNYNEMAIVTTNGQYVVAIMTEGSEGAKTTTKLIRAIDAIRKQKQDLRN